MEHMGIALKVLLGLSVLSTIVLLWIIRHSKTPRIIDFFVGVQLILIAAFFLGLMGSLRALIPEGESIKEGYDVALLIIPFFTAGLGTNIISHVVLADRDYTDTLTTKEFVNKFVFVLVVVISVVFPPVMVFYALYKRKALKRP